MNRRIETDRKNRIRRELLLKQKKYCTTLEQRRELEAKIDSIKIAKSDIPWTDRQNPFRLSKGGIRNIKKITRSTR